MAKHPSLLALIPARAGSKGIPGKNLKRLGDLPLLAHTIRSAQASRHIDRIVLTTDCPIIAECGRTFGADVPFLRPATLAEDQTAMKDVIAHAIETLAAQDKDLPELIVLLQPTCPFRTGDDIDNAYAIFRQSGATSVVSVAEIARHYHPKWQFVVTDNLLRCYDGTPLNTLTTRRQDLEPTYTRNGAIYLFDTGRFRESHDLYGDRTAPYLMPAERSVNLDTPEDWRQAELTLQKMRECSH